LVVAFNGGLLIRGEPHSVRWAGIVAEVLSLAAYWLDPRFQGKKPTPYGGRSDDAPDNIYRPAPGGKLEQVENKWHGPGQAADDIGGENALIFGQFWYFGPSVAVLPDHFNLRMTGGRRHEPCSEIDESTWRALEKWLDSNVPASGLVTPAFSGAGCPNKAASIATAPRGRC
jgi:hypothetical protein